MTPLQSNPRNNNYATSDIDFEYPSNTAQGQGLADLTTALRTAFDQLASSKGDATTYQLTAAVAAGASNYAFLEVAQMNAALSYWNLMVCDIRWLLVLQLTIA